MRSEIAAHFRGRGSPRTEPAMRAHLNTCAGCTRLYERHLLLARLDPRAPSPRERIGRALGFRVGRSAGGAERAPMRVSRRHMPSEPESWWRFGKFRPAAAWLSLTAGVAGLALWARSAGFPQGSGSASRAPSNVQQPSSDFSARGASPRSGDRVSLAPRFWTYRIPPAGAPSLVDGTVADRDELAFAYSNPTGLPYLMIFGVDEHRHVYWFHPGWAKGAPPPSAVRAAAGPGPHELPEAVRHDFDGRNLTVYLLSSRQALDARFVEETVRRAADLNAPQVFGPDIVWSRRSFEVGR
jgi:hypothetical protein